MGGEKGRKGGRILYFNAASAGSSPVFLRAQRKKEEVDFIMHPPCLSNSVEERGEEKKEGREGGKKGGPNARPSDNLREKPIPLKR